jgi:probable phosphoglycerate mutase
MDRDTLVERFPALRVENGVMAVREQPPGGERLLAFRERVLSGWERIRNDDAGTTLVVTHGGPISLCLGTVRDQNLLAAVQNNHVGNCSVTVLRLDTRADTEPTVVHENVGAGSLPTADD